VAFRAQIKRRYFGELIFHHLRKQSFTQIVHGLNGTKAMLLAIWQPRVESFIDRANECAYENRIWGMDCADAFTVLSQLAKSHLASTEPAVSDEDCFNMFQIAVLSYAYSAHEETKMRKFKGLISRVLEKAFSERLLLGGVPDALKHRTLVFV
jgi:hypothetical protein